MINDAGKRPSTPLDAAGLVMRSLAELVSLGQQARGMERTATKWSARECAETQSYVNGADRNENRPTAVSVIERCGDGENPKKEFTIFS